MKATLLLASGYVFLLASAERIAFTPPQNDSINEPFIDFSDTT